MRHPVQPPQSNVETGILVQFSHLGTEVNGELLTKTLIRQELTGKTPKSFPSLTDETIRNHRHIFKEALLALATETRRGKQEESEEVGYPRNLSWNYENFIKNGLGEGD